MNVILKALHVRVSQEFDSRGVTGTVSLRRTPVNRGDEEKEGLSGTFPTMWGSGRQRVGPEKRRGSATLQNVVARHEGW